MFRQRISTVNRRKASSSEESDVPELLESPNPREVIELVSINDDPTVELFEPSEPSIDADIIAVDSSDLSDTVSLASPAESLGPSHTAFHEFQRRVTMEKHRLEAAPAAILQIKENIRAAEQKRHAFSAALQAVNEQNVSQIEDTLANLYNLYPVDYEQAGLGEALADMRKLLRMRTHIQRSD